MNLVDEATATSARILSTAAGLRLLEAKTQMGAEPKADGFRGCGSRHMRRAGMSGVQGNFPEALQRTGPQRTVAASCLL